MSFEATDQELIEYLQLGPVLTLFSIYSNFKLYASGTYNGCPASLSTSDINHALLLIGYDSDNWIVKNSWGTSWG